MKLVRAAIVLLLLSALIQTSLAYKLVDMVQISEGDVITLTETYNNTTTTYRIEITDILSGKVYIKVDKNGGILIDRAIYRESYVTFDRIKLYYTYVKAPFLKIYGHDDGEYSINVESSGRHRTYEESVKVTVVPSPLIPGKNFYILVDGVDYGEAIVLDMGGWMDFLDINDGFAYGVLPKDVSDRVIIRIYDESDELVKTEIVEVSESVSKVSATVVPQKPLRGGGLVIMFNKPVDGTGVIIDSFTGVSNTTIVSGGIAIFKIPENFVGPVIVRITDNSGDVVYKSVLELSGELSKIGELRLTLSSTSVVVGSKVTATVKSDGDLVDGAMVYVVDESGDVVDTIEANDGVATITFSDSGTYTVYAKYGAFKSNEIRVKVSPNLQIQLSTPSPEPGSPVILKITKGATYTITGPSLSLSGTSNGQVTFTPQYEGTYVVTATIDEVSKTLNVNVVKKYVITAKVVGGWLGKEIEVSVSDGRGNPASGTLTVVKPDGNTESVTVSGGRAKIKADKSGVYTIKFGSASTKVNVPKGGISWWIIIPIAVIAILFIALIRRGHIAPKMFRLKDYDIHKKAYEDEEDIDEHEEVPPGSRKLEE